MPEVSTKNPKAIRWWAEPTPKARAQGMMSTVAFLKPSQEHRWRQAATFSRLYGNQALFGPYGGALTSKLQTNQMPANRPTMNVIQSGIDTLHSRLTQSRPRPTFLTDAGNYKLRRLGKQLTQFVGGEFYRLDAYAKCARMFKDACVLGTGVLKVVEKADKVDLERVLPVELMVDPADAFYGSPQNLYQIGLVNKDVLMEAFKKEKADILKSASDNDSFGYSTENTTVEQVLVVEGWHLPSAPGAGDGRHVVAYSGGSLVDEPWEGNEFPFIILNYSDRVTGFFGQGAAEQLLGTQIQINKLLVTISRSINLMGVPRIFIESGSKIVSQHFNNEVGGIIEYQGTLPSFVTAPSNHPEIYGQLQRLVDYSYQQLGISQLAASQKKPQGLDSGAALREYDDLQSDRFADFEWRYDNAFVELARHIVQKASEIASRTGSYTSVYPGKEGVEQIDLPEAGQIDEEPYVIQCFKASSLPKDPAGRKQAVVDLIQSGMVSIREGRRLLDYPDLAQEERLANASEERILQALDKIIEDGVYTPPDPLMDLDLCVKLSTQYYNLYVPAQLDEEKAKLLLNFNASANDLKLASMPQQPLPVPGAPPLAQAEPLPTSPLVPQTGAQE